MAKPKTFKSAVLMRRIAKFEKAVEDRAWKGAQPPACRDDIDARYRKARLALVEYVIEHTT